MPKRKDPFDYSIFGCNETEVRKFAKHFGLDKEAIEEGVYVVPGDALRYTYVHKRGCSVIVMPWENQVRNPTGQHLELHFYYVVGNDVQTNGHGFKNFTDMCGKRVIGLNWDKAPKE